MLQAYRTKIGENSSIRQRKNPKQREVVAVDSCFAILVAHHYGATNREALLKNTRSVHSVLEPRH